MIFKILTMKKFVLVLLALSVSLMSFAQDKEQENKSESKTLEFMSKGGSLIKKEFFDIGSVKGVKCQVLIITDLLSDTKMGCLRLETRYSSSSYSSSQTYIGTLDYDEIGDCIASIDYIRENIITSTPPTYTETTYKTRDNIEVGTYYSEKSGKWMAYVYTKNYTSRSAEFFDSSSLLSLSTLMTTAKNMITEKIQ